LTVRLPDPVYKAARRLAKREGISINRLVADAIGERARAATIKRLQSAYDVLADDAEAADVEPLMGMQIEALLDG